MFERLFPNRGAKQPSLPEPDAQLALGALLVRVALSDNTYRVEEVSQIDEILQETFDLKPIAAAKLRATCEALERDAPGTDDFAEILRDEIAYEDRRAMAFAMWKVVLSDGKRRAVEVETLRGIEAALGLTPEDSSLIQAMATGAAPNA